MNGFVLPFIVNFTINMHMYIRMRARVCVPTLYLKYVKHCTLYTFCNTLSLCRIILYSRKLTLH